MNDKTKPIVWFEGIIGSGKSSISKNLGNLLKLRVLYEPVDSNPYLEDFYKDKKRWAFAMQLHLLVVRANMQDLAAAEVISNTEDYNGVILDRGLPGDHAFARMLTRHGYIHEREYETYKLFYLNRTNTLKPPSIMLFLDVEPEVAMRRIKERARGAESGMTIDYLKELRDEYYDLMVELQNGMHDWCGKVDVVRIPYNVDHQPLEKVVEILKERFPLLRKQAV